MRIRQHVNPLKSEFLSPQRLRVDVPPGREVEVEVGCAEAQFLFQRIARDPRVFAVGVEIRRELAELVNRQAKEAGLGGALQVVYANATVEIEGLFPPGSVARIFVNFPDPWFKKRHKKRRLVEPALAAALAGALRPGGELFFQSDVFELALDAMAVLEEEPALENRAGPWAFWKTGNPYGVTSRREDVCTAEHKPIWRMCYRRVSRP